MKKLIYFSMAALMVLAAVSCKKDAKPGNGDSGSESVMPDPSVETLAASEVEANSAILHARIGFSGASRDNVYYGFFWGTSENPDGTYSPGEGALDENDAYSVEIMGLTPATEYWFKAFVEIDGKPFSGEILNFTTGGKLVVAPETVDLGIVVNGKTIKWGSFNLGATKPEEYGDYYAWGETEPKEDYGWSTYKFGRSGTNVCTKYNYYDNKTVLDTGPEGDDVASKLLGGKWRMPTEEEWNELITQCTFTATERNGIQGVQVTAANGKNIFLPSAGFWMDIEVLNPRIHGVYWSSTLESTSMDNARLFNHIGDNDHIGKAPRNYGISVRPVYEE